MGQWTTLMCAKEPRKNYDLIDLKKYSQRSCWFHDIIMSKLPLLSCFCTSCVCGWYVCVCVSRAVCSTVTAGRSVCQHIRLVNGEHTPERVCVYVWVCEHVLFQGSAATLDRQTDWPQYFARVATHLSGACRRCHLWLGISLTTLNRLHSPQPPTMQEP